MNRPMPGLLRLFSVARLFIQEKPHMQRAEGDERGGHIQSAAPAKFVCGPTRYYKCQRAAKLIAGADDPDGAAALQCGEPIRRHADGRRPTERLDVAVAGPNEGQEIKRC